MVEAWKSEAHPSILPNFHTSILACLCVSVLCFGFLNAATAHPISPQNHDRTVFIHLLDAAIEVEYVLDLDEWTLATDLVPFSAEIDYSGDSKQPHQLYDAYGRIYGKRIAAGLVAELDGKELRFRQRSVRYQPVDNHLRFTFVFQAQLPAATESDQRDLRLTDSNFALESGTFRIAARGKGQVQITSSNVAPHPIRAEPISLQGLEAGQDEKARTALVRFTAPATSATTAITSAVPEPETPSPIPTLWKLVRSGSITQLLNSNLGLVMVLVLAFVFGAAHALQPGHGKTLVAAYLVGEQGTIAHAFFLGFVTTLTHTSMVIFLAVVVPLIYPEAGSEIAFGLALGCGVLVVLMAFWLLLRRLAGQADHVHLFGGHHHDHGHHQHHHIEPGQHVGWWALVSLGITGGMVPCVDALALLTATWVTHQLWLGLPLILSFSLGLASVLVAVGVLTVKFKRFASSKWGEGLFVRSLPIVSALLTLALGLWMCHDAVSQRRAAGFIPAGVESGADEPHRSPIRGDHACR